jgi:hypothetical protein
MVVSTGSGLEACLFRSCLDVVVVRVKVSKGIEPFSPMEIDSANTSQPPNGEIFMDKSRLLQNNPAPQKYRYTSVPIEAAEREFRLFLILGPLLITRILDRVPHPDPNLRGPVFISVAGSGYGSRYSN